MSTISHCKQNGQIYILVMWSVKKNLLTYHIAVM